MQINDFSTILYTALIAFFGAACKEINDKTHDTSESFAYFFGDVILNGFSGWIIGLCANKWLKLDDLTSITIFAGFGGLFGFKLATVVLKMFLQGIAGAKNVTVDTTDIDDKKKGSDK